MEAPEVIYTDGRSTFAPAPVFSQTNANIKYIRADLAELTIEDIELLHTFLYAIKNNKTGCFTFTRLSNVQYQEALDRFNKNRNNQQ